METGSWLNSALGSTRAEANHVKKIVTSNEHRAFIARRTGISRYIRFNEREGAQSSRVLAKAVNAGTAVIFFDCGKDIGIVLKTMRHLGIFSVADQTVNPELLSREDLPDSLDVGSLVRFLFSVNTGG